MKELLTLRLKVGQLQQLLTLPLIAVRTEFIIKDMAVVTSIRQATISRTYFRRCVLLWNIVLIVAILQGVFFAFVYIQVCYFQVNFLIFILFFSH